MTDDLDDVDLDTRLNKSPDHPHNWTVQQKQQFALGVLLAFGLLVMLILTLADL